MGSEARVPQQGSRESSVLFMQQEHAATLKALHQEINKLQNKCTDLTFQLTMNGVNIEEEGDADSRLQELSSQLKASQAQKAATERQLSEQDTRLQQLGQELRTQKKRHLDETREAERTISGLKAEVEAKANNIQYLTSQLHRLKLRSAGNHPPSQEDLGTGARAGSSHYSHLPTPPRDLLTNSARSARQRGSASRPGVRRVGTIPAPRVSGSDVVVPDISTFVRRGGDLEAASLAAAAVEVKKPAPPLPPIAGSRSAEGGRVKERGGEVHRVIIAKGGQLTRASVPEVATLAVDHMGDVSWKRAPQSHHISENN